MTGWLMWLWELPRPADHELTEEDDGEADAPPVTMVQPTTDIPLLNAPSTVFGTSLNRERIVVDRIEHQ